MNLYAIAAAIAVWMVSLFGVGVWQNSAGHTAERADWQTRENKELRDANELIVQLQATERQQEQAHANKLDEIAKDREKERVDAKTQRDRDMAAARAGDIILRFNAAGQPPGAGGISTPGTGACQCDDRPTGELPGEIAASLLDLANDADDVARQLAAAQAVIREDRRLCGG